MSGAIDHGDIRIVAEVPGEDGRREVGWALWRGWGAQVPGVRGEGGLMDRYLEVRDACPVCGTEFHHHRADDGPAWATTLDHRAPPLWRR